ERRCARRHHAVLVDEQRNLGGAAVLGERRARQRSQRGCAEDRRDRAAGRYHGISGRRLPSAGNVSAARLSQVGLLQRGRQGRPLRRLGAAPDLRDRAARCVQIASADPMIDGIGRSSKDENGLVDIHAEAEMQQPSTRKGSAMKRKSRVTIAIATTMLAVLGGPAAYAQDKYSLKSPSGIAFSDFKGYEDWAVVSSARTDEVLKVIVANPVMIKAYKAGVPGNGKPFPEGSKIAKLQWSFKKSTEATFVVDVPDAPTQAFVIEKDS